MDIIEKTYKKSQNSAKGYNITKSCKINYKEVILLKKELNFNIDACKPDNNSVFDKDDTKIAEAIYTIFPLKTENAILFWGEEQIELSYRYDFSIMIEDILEMILNLQSKTVGEWSVDWSSDTFATNWNLIWSERKLEITAVWREEFNAKNYLKDNNIIKIDKYIFLNEWKGVLNALIFNLLECGYDDKSLIDMKFLIDIYNTIH